MSDAAAEGSQRKTEMMKRMQQQEVQVEESRWMEETPQGSRQQKRTDRTEMRKEEKRLKCTLPNGSAWSTEKKYMRKYKVTFDVFFEIEHRLRRGGNGGAVNQRGKGRMEVCGRRGENHG